MHILIGLLTLLGGLAAWYLRLKAIGTAAKDIGNMAERAVNMPRKFAFARKASHTGLKTVEDPREAAAILLVLIAGGHQEQDLKDAQIDIIHSETSTAFELTDEEADALLTHAVWMVRDVDVPAGVMKRMAQIIVKTPAIGAKELVELDAMLVATSEALGTPEDEQLALLQIYRDQAGLRA